MKYGLFIKIPESDDLRQASEQKFLQAKEMGFESCQLVYKPKVFDINDAKIIKESADKYGIEISAQFCGFPDGNMFWDTFADYRLAGINSVFFGGERINYLLSAIPFLKTLGITDMVIHAGFIPNDPFCEQYGLMLSAVTLLGKKLAKEGLNLLFETGGESPIALLRIIQDSGLDNLFVNLDTANFILYGYGNPVDAVYTIGQYIRNVHAKDGLPPTDPKKHGKEVNIGTGFVDFDKVFKLLKQKGYDRYITIERELGGNDNDIEIAKSLDYLKNKWHNA